MKLFNKIAILSAGVVMAIASGVAIVNVKNSVVANAAVTNDITLTATGGTSASTASVTFNGVPYDAIKCGSSGTAGAMVITIPAKTTSLSFYACGWKGETVTLGITPSGDATSDTASIDLKADTGLSNNSPFTLAGTTVADYAFSINLSGVESETTVKLAATKGKRFAVWNAKATIASANPDVLTGVTLDPTFAPVKIGTTQTLTPTLQPTTAKDVTYEWTTSDADVATVADGVVTPISKGIADITVTAKQGTDKSFTATSKVVSTVHAGTQADPFGAEDAVNVALGTGTTATKNTYYVSGVVKNLSISSGQVTFDIEENGKTFTAFKTYDDAGKATLTATDIKNGDTAVVATTIINYNGNTPEGSYGKLVSVTSNATLDTVEIRGEVTQEVSVGDDFILSELSIYAVYSDESEFDVTDKATISCDPVKATEVGTTEITVTASYEGVTSESRKFNVTVKAATLTATDTLTAEGFGIAKASSYAKLEAKSFTSKAVYTGNATKKSNGAIQLRSSDGAGIITTKAGGKRVKSVTFTYESGTKTIALYGSNTPYAVGEKGGEALYSSGTQGTQLGTLSSSGTINVVGDYKYIGFKSSSGAIYLTSVEIVWELYSAADIAAEISTMAGGWENHVTTANCASNYQAAKAMILTLDDAQLAEFKNSHNLEIVLARTTYENWCAVNGDETPYEGDIVMNTNAMSLTGTNTEIAIVVISFLSLSVLAAYAIIKRRKLVK